METLAVTCDECGKTIENKKYFFEVECYTNRDQSVAGFDSSERPEFTKQICNPECLDKFFKDFDIHCFMALPPKDGNRFTIEIYWTHR